jgi:hypothetical protein
MATPLLAQQGTTELRGRVVDAQGGALPGVTVTVRNQAPACSAKRSAAPTARSSPAASRRHLRGRRRAPGLQEVRPQGPDPRGRQDRVDRRQDGGRRHRADGQRHRGIPAGRRHVEGNRRQHHERDADQLPSVNGNFIGFIGLLPGIVPSISTESFGSDSISVNGQDPRNNNYTVDGGNNNDDVIGQRAGMQARTPIEAIQEFQVITNQFDAEFGRTSGAVVNAVTKAGTNQVRGSAFGYFQDGRPDGEGLLHGEGLQAHEGRHAVPALRRDRRRAARQGQDPHLRQPRSASRSTVRTSSTSRRGRPQRLAVDADRSVEHDHSAATTR